MRKIDKIIIKEIQLLLLFVAGTTFIICAGIVYSDARLYLAFFLTGLGVLLTWAYLRGYFSDRMNWRTSEKGKENCKKILSFCEEEACFLAGEGNSDFMEDQDIKQMLDKLISKSIRIRFLFGPHYDVRSVTFLKWAKEGKVEMRWLRERAREHFKVIDKTYLQVADEHDPLDRERTGYTVYSPRKGGRKWKEFEKRWQRAEVFDVVERIKTAEEGCNKFIEEARKSDEFKRRGIIEKEGKWAISAGFIKGTGRNLIPATKEEIVDLKRAVGILEG